MSFQLDDATRWLRQQICLPKTVNVSIVVTSVCEQVAGTIGMETDRRIINARLNLGAHRYCRRSAASQSFIH